MSNTEVFISYFKNENSEKIISELCKTLSNRGIERIYDRNSLEYKANIIEFIEKLGEGNKIIIVLSDDYLKSEECMFEILEIRKSGNVWERIFPIILNDAKIFDELEIVDYIIFWENKIESLNKKIKEIKNITGIEKIITLINKYSDIRRFIDEIIEIFRNMNTLNEKQIKLSGFDPIIKLLATNQITSNKKNIMEIEEIKKEIETLIEKDKIQNAIQKLKEIIKNQDDLDTLTLLSANLKKIEKEDRRGNMSFSEVTSAKSKINSTILEITNSLEFTAPEEEPENYNIPKIVKLINNAFNDTDLTSFCMMYFDEVYNNFTDGMNKLQKITNLIDYVKRHIKFAELLDNIKEHNAAMYEQFKPYKKKKIKNFQSF